MQVDAKEITEIVMCDLRGRKAIFDDIEPDIQEEIARELEAQVQTYLEAND